MACVPCNEGNTTPRKLFRIPSTPQAAVAAGSVRYYDVIDASGRPVGRKWQSLISAQNHATRIGGKVKPL